MTLTVVIVLLLLMLASGLPVALCLGIAGTVGLLIFGGPDLLIGILSGILWFQGTLIASRLDEMNSYSQQLTDLKAKSGAGVEILTDDTRKNKYYVVLPKSAKGVELYTSKNDKQVVTYTAK